MPGHTWDGSRPRWASRSRPSSRARVWFDPADPADRGRRRLSLSGPRGAGWRAGPSQTRPDRRPSRLRHRGISAHRRTPVPLLEPCNGSFPLTADTSRLAAMPPPVNAQARCHAIWVPAPFRYREHPQWPRRRASHILGEIVPRCGHHADLPLPGTSWPGAWLNRPAPRTLAEAPGNCIDREIPDAPNVRRRAVPDARNICHTRKHGHRPARTWHGAARIGKLSM